MAIEVKIDEKGKKFTITGDLETPASSKTGKSMTIASTRGNMRTGAMYKGKEVTLGMNMYFSARE